MPSGSAQKGTRMPKAKSVCILIGRQILHRVPRVLRKGMGRPDLYRTQGHYVGLRELGGLIRLVALELWTSILPARRPRKGVVDVLGLHILKGLKSL